MKRLLAIAAMLALVGNAEGSSVSVLSSDHADAAFHLGQVTDVGSVTTSSFLTMSVSDPGTAWSTRGLRPLALSQRLDDVKILTMPLPAAGWLFGSALVGFVMMANRRKV